MAKHSINENPFLINQQVILQEQLSTCLAKADALTYVALTQEFLNCPKTVAHDYLCTLGDLIDMAREISDHILNCSTTVKSKNAVH